MVANNVFDKRVLALAAKGLILYCMKRIWTGFLSLLLSALRIVEFDVFLGRFGWFLC